MHPANAKVSCSNADVFANSNPKYIAHFFSTGSIAKVSRRPGDSGRRPPPLDRTARGNPYRARDSPAVQIHRAESVEEMQALQEPSVSNRITVSVQQRQLAFTSGRFGDLRDREENKKIYTVKSLSSTNKATPLPEWG